MTVSELNPSMLQLFYFVYQKSGSGYDKISLEKTQYAYRFLFIDKGCVDVCIGGKTHHLFAGDLLYLIPGDKYRLLPQGKDFSLYNLFFYFQKEGEKARNLPATCIFAREFRQELCPAQIIVTDAPCFNKSGVFRGIDAKRAFERFRRMDENSPFYAFYTTSQLRAIIGEIAINNYSKKSEESENADKIISYIYSSYDKNICAKSIASAFFYHQNYVNKLIKQKTGKSLSEFIRRVKIEHAIALLLEADATPNKIYHTLGYYDYSHFYKAFVAETGSTPSEYKKRGKK